MPKPTDESVTEKRDICPNVTLVRETLRGDVRDHILEFLKHNKEVLPFNQLSEAKQRDLVERTESFSSDLLEKMAQIITADGHKPIVCGKKKIEGVEEGIRVVITTTFDPDVWGLLGEAQQVAIVKVDTRAYRGERRPGEGHVTPDQGKLSMDGDDNSIPGGDQKPVFDQTTAGKKTGGGKKAKGRKSKGDETLEVPESLDRRPGSKNGNPNDSQMEKLVSGIREAMADGEEFDAAITKVAPALDITLTREVIGLAEQALGIEREDLSEAEDEDGGESPEGDEADDGSQDDAGDDEGDDQGEADEGGEDLDDLD